MDRRLRRLGYWLNFIGLFGPARAKILATAGLHISGELRRVINGLGYCVDELAHRSWQQVEIRAPLFVVAPARSGTTMFFHLLAGDERFAAPSLGNTLIRSISVTRSLRRAAARESKAILDARDKINETMASMDHTHVVRIERLEEDEGFFNDVFATMNLHLWFPTLHQRLGIVQLDERPPAMRRAVMRRYRNFIRRFLYLAGGQRTYLCKNVHHAGRLATLTETFPDARFIHIIREPTVQIPSALGLMRALAKNAHQREQPADDPLWAKVAETLVDNHRRLLRWERKLGPARWLTLRYDELIADPAAGVARVYDHFDIELDDARREQLRADVDTRAASFRKQREYGLAEYGLDAAGLREQLAEVYEAYGLD